MDRRERLLIAHLQEKITQHEQTIAQLVRMVASMNKHMTEIRTEQQKDHAKQLLVK